MTDLKIPNLNKKSDKFFFKKKLTLRRKSKIRLIKESFFMLLFSNLILLVNYFIPNKKLIFNQFYNNFNKLSREFMEMISYLYEICLAIFIIVSIVLSIILILGAISRILKILRRKTRKLSFK